MKTHLLYQMGNLVKIERSKVPEGSSWCAKNCKGTWKISKFNSYDDYAADQEREKELLKLPMEEMMTTALAREIQKAMDQELLEKLGYTFYDYFLFEIKDEALMFKLVYG